MRFSVVYLAAAASVVAAEQAAGACSPLELIYGIYSNPIGLMLEANNSVLARATTEAVGFGAAGKALKEHLEKDLPGSTAYPVNYPVRTMTGDLKG
jgi:hypothetical protein